MGTYNLGSYDAAHVVTALEVGASELASVDGDFERVADLITVRIIRDPSQPLSDGSSVS